MEVRTLRRQAVAVGLLALVACGGCAADTAEQPIEGPVLAVVSYAPDEVLLIEPGTLSVIERIGLRSMGTDPLPLEPSRTLVTAQCGGLGGDADDALALIDLRQGGKVTYVDLPEPNPGSVEAAGEGAVLVSYGVWDPGGIHVTRVDVGTGAVTARAVVANAYGPLAVAAGSLWTVGPEGDDVTSPEYTVRRSSLDLAVSEVFPADGRESLVAPDGSSRDTVIMATSGAGSVRVSRVSAVSLEVVDSVRVDGIREGVSQVVDAGDLLVMRDSSGADMTEPGGPLIVLDRATLREVRRIDVGGSVASIAALGGTVYAIRWDTGELIMLDPATGAIMRRTSLEGLGGRMAQLAAMDVADAPSGPK